MKSLILNLLILILIVPGIIIGAVWTCIAIGFAFGQDFIEKRAEAALNRSKSND